MMLISLDYSSLDVRRDTTEDDVDLTAKIKGASSAVMHYCNWNIDSFTDSNGSVFEDSNGIALDVPDDIQLATALLVRDYYSGKPSAPVDAQYGYGYLPQVVVSLLMPYRLPVVS